MNDLRTAAQQALEALEYAQQGRECPSTTRQAITALRAAQQALEALKNNAGEMRVEGAISILETALAQQAEPVDTDCHAQGICQRSGYGIRQQAEPVEPVAWLIDYEDGEREVRFVAGTRGIQRTPLYTAPPQRKPLTEKEMYAVEEEARKNFRLSQKGPRGQQITYWDGLTPWLIRAVERAHGIKE